MKRVVFGIAMLASLLAGERACLYAEAADASTIIDVSTFGAKPGEGQDATDGVRAAMAACVGKSHPTVMFPPGEYHFSQEKQARFNREIEASGIDDLTIDGQGSTLIFSGHANPLFFEKCHRLTVRNVKIDWDRMPFSQGKVVAATDQSMDVQVDPEYPVTGKERYQGVTDYDVETRFPLANIDAFHPHAFESVQLLAPQKLRITFSHQNDPEREAFKAKYLAATIGKLVVLRHEVYGNFALDLMRCEDVHLENVSIYACPGMGLHAAMTKNITSDHVEIRIKPGSGRLMSTTADCQFYIFCSGLITINDGFYEGMGDDGMCVAAKYRQISQVTSPTTLEATVPFGGWTGPLPVAGEKLEFLGTDMTPKGTATVHSATWDAQAKSMSIVLEQPLAGLAEKELFISESYMPQLRVARSTFQGMRSRGMIFSTRDVKVTDCLFKGTGYPGIMLDGGLRHGVEGPAPTDVEIRNCTFEGCGGAAVYAYPDGVDMPAGALKHITIEGNTIRPIPALAAQRFVKDEPGWMHWAAGICLISVKDGRIANNTIEGGTTSVYLRNSEDIVIEENHATPPAPVLVDEATCKNITLKDTNAGLSRQPATPDIKPDLQFVNVLQ